MAEFAIQLMIEWEHGDIDDYSDTDKFPTPTLLERRATWKRERAIALPDDPMLHAIGNIIGCQEYELTTVRGVDLEIIDAEIATTDTQSHPQT